MTDETPPLIDEPVALGRYQLEVSEEGVFSYQSIVGHDSIRILTLNPSHDPASRLSGRLTIESLDTAEPYDTISYVWGAPVRTQSIYLDGTSGSSPLPLTTSIHGALRRLRFPERSRRLWADQVCINQDDVAERSRQVRLMNRIYRGAAQVLVWLGEDNDGVAEEAATMIERLASVFRDEKQMEVFRREHVSELAQRKTSEWEPLARLTKLPWVSGGYKSSPSGQH